MSDISDAEEEYNRNFDDLFDDASDGGFHDEDVGEPQLGGWNAVNEYDTILHYDDVDELLLETARAEVPIVMNQIRSEIPGNVDDGMLSRRDFFDMWFKRTVVDDMIRWIKKYGNKTLSPTVIGRFLRVEFYLSAYHCSSREFYNSELETIYSVSKTCMKEDDYLFILKALSGNKETDQAATIKIEDPSWTAKYVKNKDLERVVNNFRSSCVIEGFCGCRK